PIPNREVKPGTADDTWIKPGKVGSRHNTITKRPSQSDGLFFASHHEAHPYSWASCVNRPIKEKHNLCP
ncbi:hypothetical protein, partial [Dyadobacter flavalbus]|uniref:hypothetical protein n=1 Tax=Dyadobacter flavalbus TaxID=2579942 RepID=UPI001E2DB23E